VIARRRFLRGALIGCLPAAADSRPAAQHRHVVSDLAFGTRVRITLSGVSPAAAARAAEAGLAEVRAVAACVDLHDPASPLARLNRDGRLDAAPPVLQALLSAAARWHALSQGGFDPSVQPLWRLRLAAWARGTPPAPAALDQALSRVDFARLTRRGDAVQLAPGMALTLNGLAQGLATDLAWAAVRRHGAPMALVDAGELRAGAAPAAQPGWRIGWRPAPADHAVAEWLVLHDAAVATSGDDGLAFTPDRREHHILDPRRGHSPRELARATVIAPDACSADALATTCLVLGSERSLALAADLPGVAISLRRKDGMRITCPRWPA
jgi:thiamine biosynthesis lipoprotein